MTVITIEELTQIAEDFLRKYYGMSLEIPIVRNNRLRTAMGRFLREMDDTPHSIDIGGFMFQYASRDVIIDTLLHECVHYALFTRGEPFDDGHPHFEAELARYGIGSTGTNIVGAFVMYKCDKCGKQSETRHRRLLREYKTRVTWCCRAKINIVGERIYNGTEAIE